VRLYFLDVGHTHIIIDQIFGVITVGLRREELLTLQDLTNNIHCTLSSNPKYQPWKKGCQLVLGVTDWRDYFLKDCGVHQFDHCNQLQRVDEHGKYKGMHDMIITLAPDGHSRLKYREKHNFEYLPEVGQWLPCPEAASNDWSTPCRNSWPS
jgi:hypothetical protein